jgi:hypothetical protein
MPAIIGGAVVLVIVAIAVGWFAMKNMFGPPAKPADVTDSTAKGAAIDPAKTAPTNLTPLVGKDFVGYWYEDEKGSIDDATDVFVVKEVGGKLELGFFGDAEGAPTLSIKNQSDTVLECEATFPDGKIQPLKLELQPGGKKLVATVGATEEDTEITTLAKSERPPKTKTDTSAASTESSGSSPALPTSPDDAIAIIKAQREVVQFMSDLQRAGKVAHVECDSEDTNAYHIHVFEVVNEPGGPSHTATMGWYTVDKKTGKVTNDITG